MSGLARAVTGKGMRALICGELAEPLDTDGMHLDLPPRHQTQSHAIRRPADAGGGTPEFLKRLTSRCPGFGFGATVA
jgi:hypothetical protein